MDIRRSCQDPTFGSKEHKPGLHESILNTVPTQGKDKIKRYWESNSLGHRDGYGKYQAFCSLGEGPSRPYQEIRGS